MRIVKEEHIYLSAKDEKLWDDFSNLLEEIEKETETYGVVALIDDIRDKIFELSDYVEVREDGEV